MFLNPLSVSLSGIEEYNEEKITEIIEELITRHPEIVLENKEPAYISDYIEEILIEKKIKGVSIKSVIDAMYGYGKLQDYIIGDPDITDVWNIDKDTIYYKKFGEVYQAPVKFNTKKELNEFCKRIVILNGEKINENQAKVECTDRTNGLRIVVTVKPIAVKSPFFHIRKPNTNQSLEELQKLGMLTQGQCNFLRQQVKEKKAIILAGQGGSGKTTLLSALLKEIPAKEKFVLIQETFEINSDHPNCLSELIRLSDNSYIKNYDLFDLTKFGLLESLDRMIIGELKDKEAYDFFNAIFTGHRGSMSTVHSNNAEDVIPRLVMLMKRQNNTDLNHEYLSDLLKRSLDTIIYLEKFKVINIFDVKEGKEIVPETI